MSMPRDGASAASAGVRPTAGAAGGGGGTMVSPGPALSQRRLRFFGSSAVGAALSVGGAAGAAAAAGGCDAATSERKSAMGSAMRAMCDTTRGPERDGTPAAALLGHLGAATKKSTQSTA